MAELHPPARAVGLERRASGTARPRSIPPTRWGRRSCAARARPIGLTRNQALAGELLLRLLEREVGRRQDHVRLLQLVVAQFRPGPGEGEHLVEQRAEGLRVPGLDHGHRLVVQLVELGSLVVIQPVLALGRDAHDHWPSPAFSPAPLPASSAGLSAPLGPSSAFILASSASTSLDVVSSLSWRSMSSSPEPS